MGVGALSAALEANTQRFGLELFSRLEEPFVYPLGPTWWENRLMALSMADPDLKVQLFRFVDVLPMLEGPADIRSHLVEYLFEAKNWKWLGHLAGFLPTKGILGKIVQRNVLWSASRMARKFIVGATRKETIDQVLTLRKMGFAHTLDVLGESTLTQQEAEISAFEYIQLIRDLSQAFGGLPTDRLLDCDGFEPIPMANVSIKVSALTPTFDPSDPVGTMRSVLPALRNILREARDKGLFVNFDMEQFSSKDMLIGLVCQLLSEPEFRSSPACGIAIQAYLKGTLGDLIKIRDWAKANNRPITIRLVKGAYWDFESIHAMQNDWPVPVWNKKEHTDWNYENLSAFIIENRRWLKPAFASHNIRSLAHAIALGEQHKLDPRELEFQSLYGMGQPIQNALKSMGYRVRVYAPYGELIPGMAYLVRRLLENTANDSFLRQSSKKGRDLSILLHPPREPEDDLAMKTETKTPIIGPKEIRLKPEASLDFTREDHRNEMGEALVRVRNRLGKSWPAKIDGKEVWTASEIVSLNPSQKTEVVGKVACCGIKEATIAVETCAAFQNKWGSTPVSKRTEALRKAAEIILARRHELCAWIVFEVGKSWREADADVIESIDFCRYYAQQMDELATPLVRDIPGEVNQTIRMAKGLSIIIAPWNFPLAILCGMTSASLAAGCTTIMKPAEQSSVIAAILHGIFLEAGIPPEALAFVPGKGEEIGPFLVSHPEVALIAFTGSLGVGAKIYEQASKLYPGQKQFKRVLAEMGGKNAIIVDDDADLDEAIRGVLASAFGFQGQKCSACSRVIVPHSIHDSFVSRLIEAAKTLTIGPSDNPTFALGPVIDQEAFDRIEETIRKGTNLGGTVLTGAVESHLHNGYFIRPAIFTGLGEAHPILTEEVFGPVLAVQAWKNFPEAIQLANNTPFALTAGLYSRSPARIALTKNCLKAGNIYINRKITGATVDRQPFGGFGFSGMGAKAGGPDYLLQFLIAKTTTENTMRRGFSPETVGA